MEAESIPHLRRIPRSGGRARGQAPASWLPHRQGYNWNSCNEGQEQEWTLMTRPSLLWPLSSQTESALRCKWLTQRDGGVKKLDVPQCSVLQSSPGMEVVWGREAGPCKRSAIVMEGGD